MDMSSDPDHSADTNAIVELKSEFSLVQTHI